MVLFVLTVRLVRTTNTHVERFLLDNVGQDLAWGTILYKLYWYVPPQRVWFLGLFGLKTGIHFAHFGLESGMVFEGTTGAYERSYRFNSKLIRTK